MQSHNLWQGHHDKEPDEGLQKHVERSERKQEGEALTRFAALGCQLLSHQDAGWKAEPEVQRCLMLSHHQFLFIPSII